MNIFIASAWENRVRLCAVRDELERMGHRVIARWLDAEMDAKEDPVACANVDIDDMRATELLILDTFDDERSGGGMYFELGYVCGLGRHEVWRVGPWTNIYTQLPNLWHFESWYGAFGALVVLRAL